jgi:hypothetical protein
VELSLVAEADVVFLFESYGLTRDKLFSVDSGAELTAVCMARWLEVSPACSQDKHRSEITFGRVQM